MSKLCCGKKRDLSGNTVLITGAGMGIGREMALKFAARGCRVVLWDISQDKVDKVVDEVQSLHPTGLGAHAFQCDVSSEEAVQAAAARTLTAVGHIDILVNNAGIVSGKTILELESSQITRTFGVNTFAHYWTIRAFLPGMMAHCHGHIVNISSLMGLMGGAGLTDYCGSKFAAAGLTHSLRMELMKHNGANPGTEIGCTLVCPFMINTGMFDGTTVNFFPVLEPRAVAERIVSACEYREKVVVMPTAIRWLESFLHLLPTGVADWIGAISGGLHGMDNFKGRVVKDNNNSSSNSCSSSSSDDHSSFVNSDSVSISASSSTPTRTVMKTSKAKTTTPSPTHSPAVSVSASASASASVPSPNPTAAQVVMDIALSPVVSRLPTPSPAKTRTRAKAARARAAPAPTPAPIAASNPTPAVAAPTLEVPASLSPIRIRALTPARAKRTAAAIAAAAAYAAREAAVAAGSAASTTDSAIEEQQQEEMVDLPIAARRTTRKAPSKRRTAA